MEVNIFDYHNCHKEKQCQCLENTNMEKWSIGTQGAPFGWKYKKVKGHQ